MRDLNNWMVANMICKYEGACALLSSDRYQKIILL